MQHTLLAYCAVSVSPVKALLILYQVQALFGFKEQYILVMYYSIQNYINLSFVSGLKFNFKAELQVMLVYPPSIQSCTFSTTFSSLDVFSLVVKWTWTEKGEAACWWVYLPTLPPTVLCTCFYYLMLSVMPTFTLHHCTNRTARGYQVNCRYMHCLHLFKKILMITELYFVFFFLNKCLQFSFQ